MKHTRCSITNHRSLVPKLFDGTDKRHHYVRLDINCVRLHCARCLHDSSHLHPTNLWVCDGKAAAPKAQHWIDFCEFFDTINHVTFFSTSVGSKKRDNFIKLAIRKKLVEGWIKKTNRHRKAIHFPEDSLKIFALVWQEVGKRRFTICTVIRHYHATNSLDPITASKKHMLSSNKTDSLGTVLTRSCCVFRCVCVCENLQLALTVYP